MGRAQLIMQELVTQPFGDSYTVSFNSNRGTGTMAGFSIFEGNSQNLPSNSFTRAVIPLQAGQQAKQVVWNMQTKVLIP
ncbi:hypothetical protein AZF37_01000 [endosymbiont 'TC1' of Trimyema compressum]|nr:hypothetical protein AZF37_01000 [endosymbiont 'TC1' of Trimyema compressum]